MSLNISEHSLLHSFHSLLALLSLNDRLPYIISNPYIVGKNNLNALLFEKDVKEKRNAVISWVSYFLVRLLSH